jgi:hypothetical protein
MRMDMKISREIHTMPPETPPQNSRNLAEPLLTSFTSSIIPSSSFDCQTGFYEIRIMIFQELETG